jgi:hypothetical protein
MGGLSYFTYDGLAGLVVHLYYSTLFYIIISYSIPVHRLTSHAATVNEKQSASSLRKFGPKVDVTNLIQIFNGLSRDNAFAKELKRTGAQIVRPDGNVQLPVALTATINRSNDFFEVAAFSADNARANQSFCYKLDGISMALDSRDKMVIYNSILYIC